MSCNKCGTSFPVGTENCPNCGLQAVIVPTIEQFIPQDLEEPEFIPPVIEEPELPAMAESLELPCLKTTGAKVTENSYTPPPLDPFQLQPIMPIHEEVPEFIEPEPVVEITKEPLFEPTPEPVFEPVMEPAPIFEPQPEAELTPSGFNLEQPLDPIKIEPEKIEEPIFHQPVIPIDNTPPFEMTPQLDQMNYVPPVFDDGIERKNIFKRLLVPLGIVLLIGVVCVAFFSLIEKKPIETLGLKGTRTILIYMNGSTLESNQGIATIDIQEMIRSNPNLVDNNILLYTGGTNEWTPDFVNHGIYRLVNDEFQILKVEEPRDMGRPDTLTFFLDYAHENYEAELYQLYFWGHGGGPMLGFGIDELHNNNSLSIYHLAYAIHNSNIASSQRFELIGFNSGYMATAEVARILTPYAHFLVASQTDVSEYGLDYVFLGNITKDKYTVEIGKDIIDSSYKFHEVLGLDKELELSFSLIDLSKMREVESRINNLFVQVENDLPGDYSVLVNQLTRSTCFGCIDFDTSLDLIDLKSAITNLKEGYGDKADELLEILGEAIIYEKSNITGATGLSIYYPFMSKSKVRTWLETYKNFNFADKYESYINKHANILLGNDLSGVDLGNTVPTISENNINIKVSEGVVGNINRGHYIIYMNYEDESYIPVFMSSNVSINKDGTLSANFSKTMFTFVGKDGKPIPVMAFEYYRGNGYVVYRLEGIVSNANRNMPVNIFVRFKDSDSHGDVLRRVPALSVSNIARNGHVIDASHWRMLELLNYHYQVFNNNSNRRPIALETTIQEDVRIELRTLDPNKDYVAKFFVTTTQGTTLMSNPVRIN